MPDPMLERAMGLHQVGQLAQAESGYRSILSKNPNDADTACYLGVLLHQLDRNDDAIRLLQHAVAIRPDAAILSNLGMVLAGAKQLAAAEESLRTALKLQPDFLPAMLNLGKVHLSRDNLRASLDIYNAAQQKHPASAEALCGLGDVYQAMHLIGPAAAAYQNALAIRNITAARIGLASSYLLAGHLAEGWPLYEARWEISGRSSSAGFDQPRWDGSELAGKTILLHAEQGLGDTIQFIRYAPMVKARGGKTIVLAPPALVQLLSGQPGVDRVVSDRDAVGDFDLQCPLLSLPGVFGTTLATIPTAVPFLHANPAKIGAWRTRLGSPRPTIGIAWAGSAQHENDAKRSIPFQQLQSLFGIEMVRWVSLQVERREQDRALVDMTAELHDLTDTAAMISNLDLVVCVDSAVAHLAGALGIKTWLLLPYAPDWRWMWEREDSPWYPTMRLFRQTTPGDWSGPIQRVAAELHELRHI